MTTAVIMQPTYLPWVGYFDLMDQSDVFVFLDSIQFVRRSWQQRNRVKGPHGEQMLTVPVLSKGKYYQKISEVCIDHSSEFVESHLKAIRLNYAKSKYFSRYFEDFSGILRKKHALLTDLNIDLIFWLKDALGIQTRFLRSSALNIDAKRTALLVNICRTLQVDHYLSPAGSNGYISEDNLFDECKIRLSYHKYEPVSYRQLHNEFVPYLSVLDLLFNEGEQSLAIMRSGRCSAVGKSGDFNPIKETA